MLSAFHAMTGTPRKLAILMKYCDAAVERPNFSELEKYTMAELPLRTRSQRRFVMSGEKFSILNRSCMYLLPYKLHLLER